MSSIIGQKRRVIFQNVRNENPNGFLRTTNTTFRMVLLFNQSFLIKTCTSISVGHLKADFSRSKEPEGLSEIELEMLQV